MQRVSTDKFVWGWVLLTMLGMALMLGWAWLESAPQSAQVVPSSTVPVPPAETTLPPPTNLPVTVATANASATSGVTATIPPSATPTASAVPSDPPTLTASPLPSATATATVTASPSATPLPSPTLCIPHVTQFPYVVQPGDTLFSLGLRLGVSWIEIRDNNCLTSPYIQYGNTLYLPKALATLTPEPSDTPPATPTVGNPPELSFEQNGYLAGEGETISVGIRLSPACDCTVRVFYSTRDGSALAGSDYTAVSGSLEFAPGQTYAVILIPVLADGLADDGEFFYVGLENAENGRLYLGKVRDEIAVNVKSQ